MVKHLKIGNMTKKDKEILLKDLCARLPYHVCVKVWLKDGTTEEGKLDLEHNYSDVLRDAFYDNKIVDIKPYLRPIESMTKKEIKELVKVQILSKYGKEGNYISLNNIKSIGNLRLNFRNNEWFCYVTFNSIDGEYTTCFSIGRVTWETTIAEIDLLNKHHVDYRGLIPMGLALPALDGMYNFK